MINRTVDWIIAIFVILACSATILVAGLLANEANSRPIPGKKDVCSNIKGVQWPSSIESGIWVRHSDGTCTKGFRHPDRMPDKG